MNRVKKNLDPSWIHYLKFRPDSDPYKTNTDPEHLQEIQYHHIWSEDKITSKKIREVIIIFILKLSISSYYSLT